MTNRWQPVAEWVGFQLVWLVCAMGAANGWTSPGVIASAAFIAAALASRGWSTSDWLTVAATGCFGFLIETSFVATGLVRFAAPWPVPDMSPAWIIALWLAFGATLPSLARLLCKRTPYFAAILGLLSGPLAYWAGARIGALEIAGPTALTYIVIAIVWSATLPALLDLRRRLVDR